MKRPKIGWLGIIFSIIFVILASLDIYSSVIFRELLPSLEMNPMFPYGGLPMIIIFNLVFIVVWLFLYAKKSPVFRYLLIALFLNHALFRVEIIHSNFNTYEYVQENQITADDIPEISQEQKVMEISRLSVYRLLLPTVVIFGVFLFFLVDNKVMKRE